MQKRHEILIGDARALLPLIPSGSVDCAITSPPYWLLRDYGVDGQIGQEKSPDAYICALVEIFSEVHRILKSDGTFWLNIGDTYSRKNYPEQGIKTKDLVGIPWMLVFALRSKGWYLRSELIWDKTDAVPESVRDRPTRSHEHLFLLTKSSKYFFDAEAIKEPSAPSTINRAKYSWGKPGSKGHDYQELNGLNREGQFKLYEKRNKRSVWRLGRRNYGGGHYATFPEKLVEPCVLAGSQMDGVVIDPFCGSGVVGKVALEHGRRFIGIDIKPEYGELSEDRINEG